MAKLLTLLFEVTALFDMQTRTELLMLQKTMSWSRAWRGKLDPRLDLWRTAEPVVGGWIAENLGRAALGRFARRGARVRPRGDRSPCRLAKLGRWIDAWPEGEKPAPERKSSAAIWVVAVALVWIAIRLTWR